MSKVCTILFFISFLSASSYSQINNISVGQSFQEYVNGRVANNDVGGSMIAFLQKEDTQGSPYFVNNWAKGKVILKNKQLLEEFAYSLNYDKIKHQLIFKMSNNQILSVDMKDIESFYLIDSSSTYFLAQIPEISSDYLVQLYRDSLYSLYKSIDTKFYKADYENKGIYEKGFKYDRYVDKVNYFIIDWNKKVYNIRNGSKNEVRKNTEVIPAVKAFLNEKKDNQNLDNYLISLVSYLNNSKH